MKNLVLNAYGVSEMSHQEMVSENGGTMQAPMPWNDKGIPFPWDVESLLDKILHRPF